MANFKDSKVAGDLVENEILKQIQVKYPKAYNTVDKGKFSNYDLYIPEIDEGIEVKGDYKSAETGNLVIEVEMYGKESALTATQALYWVFVEGYRKIWIRPIDIYRFLEQNINFTGKEEFIGTGDNVPKWAFLVNHRNFVKYVYSLDKRDERLYKKEGVPESEWKPKWRSGWVEMIKKDSPLYFDNYSKRFDLKNGKNKTEHI